jgi:hypothetical protein
MTKAELQKLAQELSDKAAQNDAYLQPAMHTRTLVNRQ